MEDPNKILGGHWLISVFAVYFCDNLHIPVSNLSYSAKMIIRKRYNRLDSPADRRTKTTGNKLGPKALFEACKYSITILKFGLLDLML